MLPSWVAFPEAIAKQSMPASFDNELGLIDELRGTDGVMASRDEGASDGYTETVGAGTLVVGARNILGGGVTTGLTVTDGIGIGGGVTAGLTVTDGIGIGGGVTTGEAVTTGIIMGAETGGGVTAGITNG